MIRARFEIKVTIKSQIQLIKKLNTKSEAVRTYEGIPKINKKKTFPLMMLNEINYNLEGEIIDEITIKKNHLNIDKMTVEQLKIILQ
jgi:hypothetical protein